MSDRFLEIQRDFLLSVNYLPSGRQLQRSPPLASVKRHLDFCNEDSDVDYEEPQQDTEADSRDQDQLFNTTGTKTGESNSLLRGMKGYRLTPTDLEFIESMKAEKHIKELQGDLEEVQRSLKSELMLLELACAFREKAQAKLESLPSCEDLTEWIKVVLKTTSAVTDLSGLDAKSLLATVMKEDVHRAVDEKRIELTRMKKMAANKKEKEAKDRGQLEKQIASKRLNIQGLMSQLSDLKSELSQQKEAYKTLEMQIGTQEASEATAEEVDTPKELQASKTQAKHRGKGRREAAKSTEKVQDMTSQSKSTRSKPTDSQTSDKEDHANKNTSETLKTKLKSGAAAEKQVKSVKEEKKNSISQEPVRAARGRRKPPGATQPRNHSHLKAGESPSTSQGGEADVAAGDAGEEAQNTVVRRSKRIASRS